jgi:hypothetical protein
MIFARCAIFRRRSHHRQPTSWLVTLQDWMYSASESGCARIKIRRASGRGACRFRQWPASAFNACAVRCRCSLYCLTWLGRCASARPVKGTGRDGSAGRGSAAGRGRGMGHVRVTCNSCHDQLRQTVFFEPPHDGGHRPLTGWVTAPDSQPLARRRRQPGRRLLRRADPVRRCRLRR